MAVCILHRMQTAIFIMGGGTADLKVFFFFFNCRFVHTACSKVPYNKVPNDVYGVLSLLSI